MTHEKLIGITQAAREIGVSHSTLSRQVQKGQVRSHDGKVLLSQVIYDRAHNIDPSVWHGRKKRPRSISTKPMAERVHAEVSVHEADQTVHAGQAVHEVGGTFIPPSTLVARGLFLGIQEDRCSDPNVVASVMTLVASELLMAEVRRVGWSPGDHRASAKDEAPIGPRGTVAVNGLPLEMGLVRKLGCAVKNTQADALEIEASAKRRLADEYDAAQERGEVASPGGERSGREHSPVAPTAADIGLTRKDNDRAEPSTDVNDPVAVAEELILIGLDIYQAEIKRRRVAAGEPEGW